MECRYADIDIVNLDTAILIDRLTPSKQGVRVAIENQQQRIYALQYHPEVRHSVRGNEVLRRFLFHIAKISPDWKIENVLEEALEKLRKVVRLCTSYPASEEDILPMMLCQLMSQQTALSLLGNTHRSQHKMASHEIRAMPDWHLAFSLLQGIASESSKIASPFFAQYS